ncbi:RES domain-containing protein [Actimicrobium sp. GrIS 1.19]|uniref:RES family NAD+ phosphorylase n=1 Tax=Actimicrobium sp. GrIS 1.19 TaxID=3071708 RepID=UPI002DFED645|nr:RES domain-containing protein [Actimicrobium sp. GrIS 1.19]
MRFGGRWNSAGMPVIYGATTYAGAMLEVLVHSRIGSVPKTHMLVVGEVPDGLVLEIVTATILGPGWAEPESSVAREFGDCWLRECRSAVLLIPSVVTGDDGNVMINPAHPDARQLVVSAPQPLLWCSR